MQAQSFWTRMGTWFKTAPRSENGSASALTANAPAGTARTQPPRRQNGDHHPAPSAAAESVVMPSSTVVPKRELTLERLQDGYQKVVGLVESIQDHLHRQDQRSETMSRAIQSLADSMTPLNETAQQQLRALADMSDRLAEVPRIAESQREAIESIERHFDTSVKTNERVSGALDGFHRAVTNLGDATNASTAALRQMHADSSNREERMVGLLRDQSRRFTWIASIAITLAVASAAISAATLLR